MKNLFTKIAVVAALTLSLSSCYIKISDKAIKELKESTGNVDYSNTDTYIKEFSEIDAFDALECEVPGDIFYEQTDSLYKVKIEGPSNMMDSIALRIEDSTLHIEKANKRNRGFNFSFSNFTITVYSPSIKSFSLAGSGDLNIERYTGEELSIFRAGSGDAELGEIILTGPFCYTLAGSGDLNVDALLCNSVATKTAGSGDIEIGRGNCKNASFSIAGSGDVDAEEFRIEGNASIEQAGSGNIRIFNNGEIQNWEHGKLKKN